MQRRRGVRGKLDILRILLLYCEPFSTYELNAHFLEGNHEQMFRTLLEEDGMGRGPTPLEAEVELKGREMDLPAQMTCEVRQVEQMPFWTEREDAKARKKAKKQRLREEKKREKKKDAKAKTKQKSKQSKPTSREATSMATTDKLSDNEEEGQELSSIDGRSMDTADDGQVTNADNEVNEPSSSPCCTLCSSGFSSDELPVTCASCQIQTHVLCLADKFLEDCQAPPSVLVPIDGLCPSCGTHMIWDAIMDERRRLQAEKNGYCGGETDGREGAGEDGDSSSVCSDGIICLTDEDEDQDGDEDEDSDTEDEDNGSDMDDSFDDIFRSDSKPAAVESAVFGSSSSDKTKKEGTSDEDDCIDLITPVKGLGLADMSISDSPLSFGDVLDNTCSDGARELGDGGEQVSPPEDSSSSSSSLSEDGRHDGIIDLTSP